MTMTYSQYEKEIAKSFDSMNDGINQPKEV
jgi:hypothetical protein